VKLAIFLAGCLAAAPLCAIDVQGNAILLDADEMAKCAEEGGCHVVTKLQLLQVMTEIRDNSIKLGQQSCANRT
jgi:hypothetical protein